VFLHLNGGNDGLNTVIPYKDPRYRALRPSLAVDAGQVRKISETLGLHPGLSGLETLWKRERLAIVNGVGYPQPNYSHFRSTEIWYTAQPERTPVDGWLGRALDARTSDKPLRAVALGKEAPLSLACASPGVVTMTDFRRFRLPRGMEAAAAAWDAYKDLPGRRGEVGAAGAQAIDVADRIAKLQPAAGPFQGRLGNEFRKVLSLLRADLDLECIQVSFGGFDTHAAQAASHNRLLTELGNNLRVFQEQLETTDLHERVVTVVFSEFGRRATENLSAGTDHGSAGPVFVIGSGVATAFHGAQPSLDDLDGENLRFTTDFRRIYAALVRECFDLDPQAVIGDHEPLELFA
jgi:uncharacterized protein (DUF1501 family)